MPNPKDHPQSTYDNLVALLAGLATLPAAVTTILIAGHLWHVTDLIANLTAFKALFDSAKSTSTAAAMAADALSENFETSYKVFQDARAAVKPMIGRKSPALAAFGLVPNKDPQPLTVEQETQKVAKNKATRKARGTMGPKQKSKIHGTPPAAPAA